MIKRLLIANRGEIACRIIKTAHTMGIETIAIYSDADHRALHTQMATKAICIGPSPALKSYLNIEKILTIALQEQADAIHPGYGFLSENARFAAACAEKGLVFVGPPAHAIKAMGCKSEAKKIMAAAGVPLVPGYHENDQSDTALCLGAEDIGYPLLIKAAFGGGGKGMRIVESRKTFKQQLASARREAENAFGNGKLLLERYVTSARHVEVQIFFDQQGNGVYLFDRDCSLQRRHQKVIEEAPAPGLSVKLREAMGNAAVTAGKAINYQGAGTVEFLLDGDQFYFMEMNTRLQVEHPVTEMITGLDLVAWQLRVAAGEPLPKWHNSITGHAIEVRLYAEKSTEDFLPDSGRIYSLQWPEGDNHLRIDTGIRAGDSITPWYDPMMAKIIAHGVSRDAAIERLQQALAFYRQAGISDNRDFLLHLLQVPAFKNGHVSTDFIEQHPFPPRCGAQTDQLVAVAAIYQFERQRFSSAPCLQAGVQRSFETLICLYLDNHCWRVRVAQHDKCYLIYLPESTLQVSANLQQTCDGMAGTVAFMEAPAVSCCIMALPGKLKVILPTVSAEISLPGYSVEYFERDSHLSPLSGVITCVMVSEGRPVELGMPLMTLEAMKMEHTITAKKAGVVESVHYQSGDQVGAGTTLLTLEE